MLTIPTALWPQILSQAMRPIEVYEIEAFAGRSVLRYSDQDVTWGGNAYVGLAKGRTSIRQTMDVRVPECEVTFANETNVLREHLTPVDTLTGARMTIRLIFRDSGGSVLTDSVIIFRGRIEPPKQITEGEFTLSVVGLLDGGGIDVPARRFAVTCSHQFANAGLFDGGGHCSYVSNTTASGAGSITTALTLASTTASGAGTNATALTLAAASGFKNGDFVKVGSGDPVEISGGGGTVNVTLRWPRTWANGNTVVSYFKDGDVIQIGGGAAVAIASGGGTASLTIADVRSWSGGATVRHSDCANRTRGECEARGMLHRFGGTPGGVAAARARNRALVRGPNGTRLETSAAGEKYSDPTTPIPVLYGRRRIIAKIMELRLASAPISGRYRATFGAISEGEIDSVVRYFVDGLLGADALYGGQKVFGIFYRDGDVGAADSETTAEYVSDPSTQPRAQNIDRHTAAGVAYSELAYAILVQATRADLTDPNFEVDAKGVKVQKYTAAGSTDGAKAWTTNNLWHCVDLGLSDRYGLGLVATDFDFATIKPEADICDVVLSSTEASSTVTIAQGSASTRCFIVSTEGFIPGKALLINGVTNSVVDIIADTELKLGTAVTQSVGHTVIQRQARFESHLYMDSVRSAIEWLKTMLLACRGYITYDAGKIQFRIERDTCKERFVDGGMEAWTSSTNLTAGTENLGSGEVTINRDASVKHSGSYSLRIDRTGGTNFGGETWTLTGLEPGRWYRMTFWHQQDALGIGSACRLRIRNTTSNLGVESDGFTWATSPTADPISREGATSFTQYEFTFKMREDFAVTDSIEVALAPYFTAGHSVWYDDVTLRGPYAGDFREFTDAKLMGWKEGSFVWSLDRKDRETNRVVLQLDNASAGMGRDEAGADDFVHQQSHPIRVLRLDTRAIDSKDQGYRIARFHLDKRRRLGPGCEFTGGVPALVIQPGDVILVSETVPGWTCKEQRVIETQILGLGSADELFVNVRTEDYSESIYSDVGPPQSGLPPRATPALAVSVARNSGGILDLAFDLDSTYAPLGFDVHMSATSGFEPNTTSLIGRTNQTQFTYQAPVADLDEARYLVVVAVTDIGEIRSDEIATTIFSTTSPPTGGYSNDFQFPTAVATPAGSAAFSPATVGNVNDASDSTYNEGAVTMTAGVFNAPGDGIDYHTFGNGTDTGKTGRPYVRGLRATTTPGGLVWAYLYYTLDRSAGTPTWVLWQAISNTAITDHFGPELTGVDYSKFAIRCVILFPYSYTGDHTASVRNHAVAFDEKA